MKVVILAGGMGTRLSEETALRPKPMIEIGGKPIIWHIMKYFSCFGHNEFIICLGYKGHLIKEFFLNYQMYNQDVEVDLATGRVIFLGQSSENWIIKMVETGLTTETGGRLKSVQDHVGDDPFFFTYGDGVGNVDLNGLLETHIRNDLLATVTAAHPIRRFGAMSLGESTVEEFVEKPKGDGGVVNAGFFVLQPAVLDFIESLETKWEHEPLVNLVSNCQLGYFYHQGFWHPMDTLHDKVRLETLWQNGEAPWKIW
jgi:glucose-1-phosphate cytidylyltransferase